MELHELLLHIKKKQQRTFMMQGRNSPKYFIQWRGKKKSPKKRDAVNGLDYQITGKKGELKYFQEGCL